MGYSEFVEDSPWGRLIASSSRTVLERVLCGLEVRILSMRVPGLLELSIESC